MSENFYIPVVVVDNERHINLRLVIDNFKYNNDRIRNIKKLNNGDSRSLEKMTDSFLAIGSYRTMKEFGVSDEKVKKSVIKLTNKVNELNKPITIHNSGYRKLMGL